MKKETNLPEGITSDSIPGDTPEDIAYELWEEEHLGEIIEDFIEANKGFLHQWLIEFLFDEPDYEFATYIKSGNTFRSVKKALLKDHIEREWELYQENREVK